jgi:excisionase family DNA binding protein
MEQKVPPPGVPGTPAPDQGSASDPTLKMLDEIRQILRITAELGRCPTPTTDTPRKALAPIPSQLPSEELTNLPCPPGMRRATHRRLVKRHETLRVALMKLPFRRLNPRVRNRLDSQFRNALRRVRRELGLPEWEPGLRTWYSLSAAAGYLGISPRTLLRWDAASIIPSGRTIGRHRRFHNRDLARLRAIMTSDSDRQIP